MIRRSTLAVVLVLAVLIGVVYFLQRSEPGEELEATPTAGRTSLYEFDSQIMGLRVEHVGSQIVEIERNAEGIWSLKYPPAEATDIGIVESAVSQLLSTQILEALSEGPSLEEAGLAEPTYRVLIWLEDGRQERMSVGKETPTGSGYYILAGNRGMFIVNKFSLDPLLKLADNPPIAPTPTPLLEGEPSETGTPTP